MAAALQTHLHRGRLAGVDLHAQPAAGLRAAHCRIHRVLVAVDDAAMERLLRKRAARLRGRAEHARAVRLVVGEEEARAGRQLEAVRAEPRLVQQAGERRRVRVVGEQRAVVRRGDDRLRRVTAVPRPRVAEPELRDEVQRRALAAAVVRRHAHDERVLVRLGDLDLDVEVAVVVERAGVDQLVLRLARAARAVALDQVDVRERALRILVEHPLVGVARQRVDVEVTLLHVLAVVPLGRHEAEVALLENRIALVPERHRPAEDLVAIRESGDAVLAPAIGLEAREVVREKAPGVAVRAVVLAHGAPGAVREVRAPLAPPGERVRAAAEALPFRVHGIVDSLSTLIKTESPMRLVTRADLDGLTSGVIITMKEPIDEILLVHPQDITDKRVEIRGDDILANVPYHPNAGKWFDHHLLTDSNEKPPADFEGRYRPTTSRIRRARSSSATRSTRAPASAASRSTSASSWRGCARCRSTKCCSSRRGSAASTASATSRRNSARCSSATAFSSATSSSPICARSSGCRPAIASSSTRSFPTRTSRCACTGDRRARASSPRSGTRSSTAPARPPSAISCRATEAAVTAAPARASCRWRRPPTPSRRSSSSCRRTKKKKKDRHECLSSTEATKKISGS